MHKNKNALKESWNSFLFNFDSDSEFEVCKKRKNISCWIFVWNQDLKKKKNFNGVVKIGWMIYFVIGIVIITDYSDSSELWGIL